jgi:hypothetical protein
MSTCRFSPRGGGTDRWRQPCPLTTTRARNDADDDFPYARARMPDRAHEPFPGRARPADAAADGADGAVVELGPLLVGGHLDRDQADARLSRCSLHGEMRRSRRVLPFGLRNSGPEILVFAAINENSLVQLVDSKANQAVHLRPPHHQSCCNVRGRYSRFNGNAGKRISLQAAISQFNGNIDLIELSTNRCLIPKGSGSLSVQDDLGGIVVGRKEALTR